MYMSFVKLNMIFTNLQNQTKHYLSIKYMISNLTIGLICYFYNRMRPIATLSTYFLMTLVVINQCQIPYQTIFEATMRIILTHPFVRHVMSFS